MAAPSSAFRRLGSCYSSVFLSTRRSRDSGEGESPGIAEAGPLLSGGTRETPSLAPWTFVLAVVFALIPLSIPRVRGQAPPRPAVVALKGATILTVTRGTIPNGTVLLRDGKIAAVGATVDIPAGAETVDVTGKFVSPGHHRRAFAHRQ